MEIDADGELRLLNVCVRCGFIEVGGSSAVSANGKVTEGDIDALGVDPSAGVSDCGNKAPPVRIAAGPGSFDERGMCDGLGHANSIGVGHRAMDVKFDDVRYTLAISNHLAGKRGAHLGERGGKLAVTQADARTACA